MCWQKFCRKGAAAASEGNKLLKKRRPTSPKSFKITKFLHLNLLWLHKKDSKRIRSFTIYRQQIFPKKKNRGPVRCTWAFVLYFVLHDAKLSGF